MNIIGRDCRNIINDYKFQMEHIEKFQNSLKEINKISYEIVEYHEEINQEGVFIKSIRNTTQWLYFPYLDNLDNNEDNIHWLAKNRKCISIIEGVPIARECISIIEEVPIAICYCWY